MKLTVACPSPADAVAPVGAPGATSEVKTHAAPAPLLLTGAPRSAVVPSLESAALAPKAPDPTSPFPTSFGATCDQTAPECV